MKNIFLLFCSFLIVNIVLQSNAQDVVPIVQTGHADDIICINWDKTGRYIASADKSNDIVITDVIAGKQFYKFKIHTKQRVDALKFSDNSELLISTSGNNFLFDMLSLEVGPSSTSIDVELDDGGFKLRGPFLRKGLKSIANRDMYVNFTNVAVSPDGNIVIAGDERGWLYFCSKNLSLKSKEQRHYLDINDIDFTENGEFFAVASSDRSISIWRVRDNSVAFEKHIMPRSFNVYCMQMDSSGNRLAFGDELGYVYMMKFGEDKVEVEGVDVHGARINDISFSPNTDIVATAGGDNKASVVDFEKKMPLQYFRLHPAASKLQETFNIKGIQKSAQQEVGDIPWFDQNVYSVAISPDGKRIAYSGGKYGDRAPLMKVANISSLKIDQTAEKRKKKLTKSGKSKKDFEHIYYQLHFDDEKTFIGMGEQHNMADRYRYSLSDYEYLEQSRISTGLSDVLFPENYLLTMIRKYPSLNDVYLEKKDPDKGDTYSCNAYEIRRSSPGKSDVVYKGHRSFINDIEINHKHGYLISSAEDASICLWNLDSGELLLTTYVVDLGKLIFITPDNYYMATGDALTGMGFNYKGRIFPPEQFDLKYNRPDIVLQQFGYFPDDIVELYHKAYLKRLSKAGFTEEMLDNEIHMPEMHIVNIENVELNTNNENLNLTIKTSDDKFSVDRINVWINDVPVFGTTGYSLADKQSHDLTTELEVPLSIGNNKIQVSCHNSGGVESLKEEFEVYCNRSLDKKPDLYLISLAVSDYTDDFYNLRYTVNDGEGFIDIFCKNRDMFENVYVDTFFNKSCTRENVLAVKEKLLNSNVEDYVYIHIAGHGLLDDNLDFYFATSDINFNYPAGRGLKYDEIEGLLDGIPARNKLLLMDACHSGEVDKGEFVVEVASENDATRGVTLFGNTDDKPKTGLQNSFELMKLLFADLSKGTGAVVISAASGGGYALESEDMENGIFTYSLINGLKKKSADADGNKQISVSELRNHIFEEVSRLSNGKQQPTSRRINLSNDFVVW
jgi:WD40 repeat protein